MKDVFYTYWLINRETLEQGRLEETINMMGRLGWRLNHFGSDYLVFEKESSGDWPTEEPLSKSIDTLEAQEEEERIYA